MVARIFELSTPLPKSHMKFQNLAVKDEEIKNQVQTDMASGRVRDGSVKN
jgi:hypothetical protein